ncbi:MAG: heavy metal-binding domain-containing protein [Euryarchaeota archaeon]
MVVIQMFQLLGLITGNVAWIASIFGVLVYQPRKKKTLLKREQASLISCGENALTTLSTPSKKGEIQGFTVLVANVVMSPSWIQTFAGGVRALFGGRVNTFAKLLEWARREAKQRLLEELEASHYDEVINVRFETTTLTKSTGSKDKTTGFEILVYGTAVKY